MKLWQRPVTELILRFKRFTVRAFLLLNRVDRVLRREPSEPGADLVSDLAEKQLGVLLVLISILARSFAAGIEVL